MGEQESSSKEVYYSQIKFKIENSSKNLSKGFKNSCSSIIYEFTDTLT
jgi:hypothetical protein